MRNATHEKAIFTAPADVSRRSDYADWLNINDQKLRAKLLQKEIEVGEIIGHDNVMTHLCTESAWENVFDDKTIDGFLETLYTGSSAIRALVEEQRQEHLLVFTPAVFPIFYHRKFPRKVELLDEHKKLQALLTGKQWGTGPQGVHVHRAASVALLDANPQTSSQNRESVDYNTQARIAEFLTAMLLFHQFQSRKVFEGEPVVSNVDHCAFPIPGVGGGGQTASAAWKDDRIRMELVRFNLQRRGERRWATKLDLSGQ